MIPPMNFEIRKDLISFLSHGNFLAKKKNFCTLRGVRECKCHQGGWMMGNKKNGLFQEVTELTGLPEDLIGQELATLLESKGVEPEGMTMESLREALAHYLTQISFQIEQESPESSLEDSIFHSSPDSRKAPTQ